MRHLSWTGVHFSDSKNFPQSLGRERCPTTRSRDWENRLVPRSHIIQMHCFLLFFSNKNNALPRELPAISNAKMLDHGGFSSVLTATRLAISKQSTFFLCPCASKHVKQLLDLEITIGLQTVHSESAYPVTLQHHWFGTEQASQTLDTKAYSNQKWYFNPCNLTPLSPTSKGFKSRVTLAVVKQNITIHLQRHAAQYKTLS